MLRVIQSAVMILIVFFAGPAAIAQDKSGFAVNLGVGISQIKDRDGTDSFNANAFGYIIGGEYRFNDHFALGFNTFGLGAADDEFKSVNTTIEVRGLDLVARFIFPVSDGVEFFALAGSAGYKADLEPGGTNGLFGEDAVELGLGLDAGRGENFAFRLAGRYYDGPRDESGALLTVGFNYQF